MDSLKNRIYEHEEVIYTLAWLSGDNRETSPKKIIRRAALHGLIKLHKGGYWEANDKNIVRRIENPKIIFPHHSQIKNLSNILIGLGEISARSHGDFEAVAIKVFKTHFYKGSLLKIIKEIMETQRFLKKNRSIEEIGYSQRIGKTNFDWKGYSEVLYELNRGLMDYRNNYSVDFIVKLCFKIIPNQFSVIIDKFKEKPIFGALCSPIIEPLMFREELYITPLLKSKNSYLRLLACASVVQQELFDNFSSIDENINTLVTNDIDKGDAVWLSSVKLKNHYQSVERTKEQIISTRNEIINCEKNHSNCPHGINPERWISSRKNVLNEQEELLKKYEEKLKDSFDDIKAHWPIEGLTHQQINNLIHLIKHENILYQLVEFVPSVDNKSFILDNILSSVMKWLGVNSQPTLDVCKETFLYSSQRDLKRLVEASKTLLQLSNIKEKEIGRFLGIKVGSTAKLLENFSSRPYMNVRKSSQWQSATSKLACIHLLAMCVFEETPEDQEYQVSNIIPHVVNSVNLLLQIQRSPFHFGADELFNDLKRVTAHIISSKKYMIEYAEIIALNPYLPSDYRISVIAESEVLISKHSDLLLVLFEEFSEPPIYVDYSYKHFSEWICLLDICITHCIKFDFPQVAQKIINIWELNCPLYGDMCTDFVDYAQKLYRALKNDGEDRVWLKSLNGFEESKCMKLLSEY